jgi:hypothetical protein
MLNPSPPAKFDFYGAVKMLHDHQTGHAVIMHYNTEKKVEKANSLDTYLRARTIIGHHLVFDITCVCEPRNKDLAPAFVPFIGDLPLSYSYVDVNTCMVQGSA